MSWLDAFRLARSSIIRRFGRTALTVLAVTLASALMVALATIVAAGNTRVVRQLSKGGPVTGIKVAAAAPNPGQLDRDNATPGAPKDLTEDAFRQIAALPGAASVVPVLSAQVFVVPPPNPGEPAAGQRASTRSFPEVAVGVDLTRPGDLPVSVLAGRLPAPGAPAEIAVTLGYLDRLRLDTKKPQSVLGTELEIGAPRVFRQANGNVFYRGRWTRAVVVGVVAQEASPGQFLVSIEHTRADRDWALQGQGDGDRFRLPTSAYSGLIVVADSLSKVHTVRSAITDLGYSTSAPEQLVATVQRYLHVVDIVLGGIGLIALVIAALGITSALLAAVRERRREIGVLKAIGARDRDVVRWFLIEAVLVGLMGGIFGTLAGTGIAAAVASIVNRYLHAQGLESSAISVPLVVAMAGVFGAGLLALVAGSVPAWRAARLPAREAIGGV